MLSYSGVIRANQIGFLLSSKLYSLNSDILKNEKEGLLRGAGCADLDEYFTKLKRVLRDNAYVNQSFFNTVEGSSLKKVL